MVVGWEQQGWLGRWEVSQMKTQGTCTRGKVQEEAALSDISDCRVRMGHPNRVGGQGQLLEAAPGARVWD